jgi:hypothetical protein
MQVHAPTTHAVTCPIPPRHVEPVREAADSCTDRRGVKPYWKYLEHQNETPRERTARGRDEFLRATQAAESPTASPRPDTPRIADLTPIRPRPEAGPASEAIIQRRHVGTGRLIDIVV